MSAYAIAITEENLRGVIHSEAGLKFNLEMALQWLEEHGEGWFVRDPGSPFDCEFFMPEIFEELYMFLAPDRHALIRPVVQV